MKSIPAEWLAVADGPPKLATATVLRDPVSFEPREPLTEFDPFRRILTTPTKTASFTSRAVVPTMAPQDIVAMPVPTIQVEPEGPEPRLEGVVGGDDPVAVLKLGEESLFVREGENLAGGLKVMSISDGEVRLKRGNREIVLKTGA